MNKTSLILKYFQKKDQLSIKNKQYQQTISSLFRWLVDNDKVTDDKTTKFFPNINCQAKIIAKQEGVSAGLEEIGFLLKKHTNLSFKPLLKDGSQFKKGTEIAEISGKSHEILGYERTILNIIQRMSGIATETDRLTTLIKGNTSPLQSPLLKGEGQGEVFLAATRKTPYMLLDKKAVAVGGGLTHRLNLSDGILIKDNHLALMSIEKALNHLRGGKAVKIEITDSGKDTSGVTSIQGLPRGGGISKEELIEIEVTNYHQAYQAIKTFKSLKNTWKVAEGLLPGGGIDTNYHLAILLDNSTPSRAKSLLSNLSNLYNLSSIIFEASGGINEENIKEWSQTGVDLISLGSLTHSVKSANFSLELETKSDIFALSFLYIFT